ncbi:TadE/TadG family type IV pilus assembly protein [Sphingomonas sp. PB4P5]|uniref:TadE/TadG family type IV pilus assembly protein n=1 Tax=Parasphingomonas puruogangriensis TaxID=3096155 RepID=UPI002FC82112
MTLRRRLRRLHRDTSGVTAIEFAFVAPVMLLLIMGLGEMMYQEYVQVILNGSVQKAARDSAIQGGAENTTAIDAAVITMISTIAKTTSQSCVASPAARTWCSSRKSYAQFGNIKPEYIYDTNANGVLDGKECFDDVNANKTWDADPGIAGQGGANDVTLYTMSVTYARLFPVAKMIGLSDQQTLTSTTILKNQPYANQAVPTVKPVCL